LVFGAQEIAVISLSCCILVSSGFSLESQQAYLSESLLKFPGVACLGIDLRFVVVGAYGDL